MFEYEILRGNILVLLTALSGGESLMRSSNNIDK